MSRDKLTFRKDIVEIAKVKRKVSELIKPYRCSIIQPDDSSRRNNVVKIFANFCPVDETHIELFFTNLFFGFMYITSESQIFDVNISKEELREILTESYDNYNEVAERLKNSSDNFFQNPKLDKYLEMFYESGELVLYSYEKLVDWIYGEIKNAVQRINEEDTFFDQCLLK